MLVCNVSLRPPRRAIAATITEATAALDNLGSGSGQIVFATLVDDPASVGEIVDAYLGEIMLEAASAIESLDANIPATYTVDLNEAATAADTQTAATTVPFTTFNTADRVNTTLSNGDLTATSTGAGAVRAIASYSSGKYYLEYTVATLASFPGVGLCTATANLASCVNSTSQVVELVPVSGGQIYCNGLGVGSLGTRTAGDKIGVAVDLGARLIWFRVAPSGNWNNNATYDPATGVGGINISALTGVLYPFAGSNGAGDVSTANFGASSFTGTAPSGFNAGWPA